MNTTAVEIFVPTIEHVVLGDIGHCSHVLYSAVLVSVSVGNTRSCSFGFSVSVGNIVSLCLYMFVECLTKRRYVCKPYPKCVDHCTPSLQWRQGLEPRLIRPPRWFSPASPHRICFFRHRVALCSHGPDGTTC